MAFRKAAKARTKVANPRRKHRARKAGNPSRKRRASRRRNGYAAASMHKHANGRKRRNGYKRRNPEVGGMKLDGSTILTVALAGGSTALAMSLIQRSGALEKLEIQPKYQTAAAAVASAAVGVFGAYAARKSPKAKKFFMAHALISGGVAAFALAKSQTDALAYSAIKDGSPIPGYTPAIDSTVKGLYLGTGAFGHGQTGGGFMSLTDGRFVTDTGGAFVGTRAMNGY
jgi:hypothetical protein